MNDAQKAEFLLAQREVIILQGNLAVARSNYAQVKAKLETELGGVIDENTLEVKAKE
jgi:hypothetical protein